MTDEYFKVSWKILMELVSISIASAKIRKIKVIQKNRVWEGLYPPLSLWIQAEAGSLKTTLFEGISKITGLDSFKKITPASLAGSIRRESGHSITSPAWMCRNSVMLLDEFNLTRGEGAEDVKQVLLDITEKGKFKKAIAYKSKKIDPIIEGDLYYKIYEGVIEFKTRCAVIFATMRDHEQDVFHNALMSRCIPIRYKIDDVDLIYDGGVKTNFKIYKVKEEITVNLSDWNIITSFVKERYGYNVGFQIRLAGMLTKIFAVKGFHDYKLYEVVVMLKHNNGALDIEEVKKIYGK